MTKLQHKLLHGWWILLAFQRRRRSKSMAHHHLKPLRLIFQLSRWSTCLACWSTAIRSSARLQIAKPGLHDLCQRCTRLPSAQGLSGQGGDGAGEVLTEAALISQSGRSRIATSAWPPRLLIRVVCFPSPDAALRQVRQSSVCTGGLTTADIVAGELTLSTGAS